MNYEVSMIKSVARRTVPQMRLTPTIMPLSTMMMVNGNIRQTIHDYISLLAFMPDEPINLLSALLTI